MQKIDLQKFQNDPRGFLFFVAQEKKYLGIAVAISVVIARLFYMVMPFLTKKITDIMTNFTGDFHVVYLYVFALLGTVIFSTLCYRMTGFIAARWIPHIEVYAGQVSFDYLIEHSAQYFANRLSGKLQNKIFNIANAVSGIFPILFWDFLDLVVKLSLSAILALTVNIFVGLLFIFFVFVSMIYSAFISRRLSRYSWERAEAASEVRGVMVDIVGNILAVKQNVTTNRESYNAADVLKQYQNKHTRSWTFFEKALLFNNVIIFTMFAGVMFSSIYLWQQGSVSSGDVIMILLLMIGLFGDLQFLSMSFNRFMEQYGQMREGLEEVFMPYGIIDRSDAQHVSITRGDIVFDHVNFQYEDDDSQSVFTDLSLTIPAGQKVGLVGESGAGKSTFVSLLLRFVEPENGTITIDGHDITHIRQDDLRSAIAYVPQEALLFHRSLRDNIAYNDADVSDELLYEAADRAHARGFIDKLPDQYGTLIGERGVKLSGGQRQRVMIARAMLKKSPILVLDEATSALDSESEKFIQDALEELMKDRTTIAIAHRLSTLKKMDRIVVFDDGKVIEDGTHEELLALRGKYFSLWQYQSNQV